MPWVDRGGTTNDHANLRLHWPQPHNPPVVPRCAQTQHETTMTSCWALLGDMLGEARARGVAVQPANRFAEAMLAVRCCVVCWSSRGAAGG